MNTGVYTGFLSEIQKISRRFLETHEDYAKRLKGSSSDPGFEAFRKKRKVGVLETDKGPVLIKGKTPEQSVQAKVRGRLPGIKMAQAEEPTAEEDAEKSKKRAKYASIMKRTMLAKQRASIIT